MDACSLIMPVSDLIILPICWLACERLYVIQTTASCKRLVEPWKLLPLSSSTTQLVVGGVRMEGHSVQVPVHVTVLMATVGVHVEVSFKKLHKWASYQEYS